MKRSIRLATALSSFACAVGGSRRAGRQRYIQPVQRATISSMLFRTDRPAARRIRLVAGVAAVVGAVVLASAACSGGGKPARTPGAVSAAPSQASPPRGATAAGTSTTTAPSHPTPMPDFPSAAVDALRAFAAGKFDRQFIGRCLEALPEQGGTVCYEPFGQQASRLVATVGITFTSGTGGYLVTLDPDGAGGYTVVSSQPTGGI